MGKKNIVYVILLFIVIGLCVFCYFKIFNKKNSGDLKSFYIGEGSSSVNYKYTLVGDKLSVEYFNSGEKYYKDFIFTEYDKLNNIISKYEFSTNKKERNHSYEDVEGGSSLEFELVYTNITYYSCKSTNCDSFYQDIKKLFNGYTNTNEYDFYQNKKQKDL